MEHSYHQEVGEHPPNPPTSHGLHQNAQAVHYQPPQYHPQQHVVQQGYQEQGFAAPYINPNPTELVTVNQPVGQELDQQQQQQQASIDLPETEGSVVVEMSPDDFENVLTATMHAGGVTLHFRADGEDQTVQQVTIPAAPSAVQAPSTTATTTTNTDPSYRIQDISGVGQRQPAISSEIQAQPSAVNVGQLPTEIQAHPSIENGTVSNNNIAAVSLAPPPPPILPEGLRYSEVVDGGRIKCLGVYVTKVIKSGERFGPFTGDFVKETIGCNDPSTWEICVKERTWFYIDGTMDANNWMKSIEVARTKAEQNMEAYQYYGNIYFRTIKEVDIGEEFRVFYADDFSTSAGFSCGLDNLHFDPDSDRFECQDCKCRYANAKSMMRHLKFEHNKENTPAPSENSPANANAVSSSSEQLKEKAIPPIDQKIAGYLETRRSNLKTDRSKRQPKSGRKRGRPPKHAIRVVPPPPPPLKSRCGRKRKTVVIKEEEEQKVFSCKKCGKEFPSEGPLKEHAAFHKETKSLKPICEVCGLECQHNRGLKQHMLSHDANSFQCRTCKRYFRRKGALVYHLRHDHGEYVGEKWMRENQEEKLARYVGPENQTEKEPFHPEVPQDMLGKRIVEASKKPKVFKCKYCPKKFAANHEVFRHEKLAHMNGGRFTCEYCFANFMEESRLILHTRTHTKERPYKCADCQLSFASESALRRHEPEHRGERPHKCDVCGKSFRSRNNMNTHKRRLHTNVLLKCSFCDQTFKLKTSLTRHEQRHKGIRPFVCLTCGKAFGTKYSLQAHARVHTGEKPFECKVCHQRFALNHTLVYHMIRHEQGELTLTGDVVEMETDPMSEPQIDPGEELIRNAVLANQTEITIVGSIQQE